MAVSAGADPFNLRAGPPSTSLPGKGPIAPTVAIGRVPNNEGAGSSRETLVSRTVRDLGAGSGLRFEDPMRCAVCPRSLIYALSRQ